MVATLEGPWRVNGGELVCDSGLADSTATRLYLCLRFMYPAYHTCLESPQVRSVASS
jgi:hypothetical protein